MLKFEFVKKFHAKHNKVGFEVIWWLRPWCIFMSSWVQSLMDVCIKAMVVVNDIKTFCS
jgi:hypothetical protein